ncbi:MAG: arsenate reductase ArsC [Verrucomicrobiota bacterium]
MSQPLVLVLCTGNSCRSQMAEAFLRHAAGGSLEVASAGSQPSGLVHPLAVRAMEEVGIDISEGRSKHLNEFLESQVETVITVCGNANQLCPSFPGQINRYHWAFEDPAIAEGSEEEIMSVFRVVRDEIRMVFQAYGRGRVDGCAEMVHIRRAP